VETIVSFYRGVKSCRLNLNQLTGGGMTKTQNLMEAFASLIKELRIKKGLTIEQLSDLAGVHRTAVGLLERNERTPTMGMANQIAIALGCPLHELMQEASLILSGSRTAAEIAKSHEIRIPKKSYLRNTNMLTQLTGLTGDMLLGAISSCYQTLDLIDEQMDEKESLPLAHLVELANLSSMMGNLVGAGIAECSNGLYERNKPHTYPDLLPKGDGAVSLELKVALETNKPKGHLPKAGTYITFRYVLGDKLGNYKKGKETRGDTIWIWEVKVGEVKAEDFSCSNTAGDSGKTAVIKTDIFNKMALVYYAPQFLPYAGENTSYPGYN